MSDLLTNIPSITIDKQEAFFVGFVLGLLVGFYLYNLWRQA